MTIHEYQIQALRTAAAANQDHDLWHAVLGLVTEAGELADVLKKQHAYGKELDHVNLMEETGDVLWYLALMARALGVDLDAIAERNIRKLATRYPGKFTQAAALERNLEAERKTLEATTTKEAAYFNHGYREPKNIRPPTLSAAEQIAYLVGSNQNGIDRTLRFWHDDEDQQYWVMVDEFQYSGYCLEKALEIAVAEERKKRK